MAKARDSHTPAIKPGAMVAQVKPPPYVRKKRPRTCVRADGRLKKAWDTKAEAVAELKSRKGNHWRRSNDWGVMRLYLCKTCRLWHYGHRLVSDP